jgi:hypothetical protein
MCPPAGELATAGAIDRAAPIHLAVDAVSSDANAGLNADTARAHADTIRAHANTGRNADTGGTSTNARSDAYAARTPALSPLPNTALRRAIGITVDPRLSRRCNQH